MEDVGGGGAAAIADVIADPYLSRHKKPPRALFLKHFFFLKQLFHSSWVMLSLFLGALGSAQDIQAEMDHEGFDPCG